MGAGVRAPLAMDAAVTDGATDSAPVPGREPVDVASVGAPETASESAPQTPVNGEVALEFSGPCWIDVRDASGAVVLTGEMAKGDRRVLEGQPPYSFVIGNAGATSLTVGGEPFDLQGRSRGNVARFKLNPEAPE
jgi:cytoskeleton protein RodZ